MPIIRKAVRVESKRKAILLVGAAGMLRLLTLAVSPARTSNKRGKLNPFDATFRGWNECNSLKLHLQDSPQTMFVFHISDLHVNHEIISFISRVWASFALLQNEVK